MNEANQLQQETAYYLGWLPPRYPLPALPSSWWMDHHMCMLIIEGKLQYVLIRTKNVYKP